MIWGAVSLLGIIVFYVTVAYQIGTRNTRTVESDDHDVRFVLEWFGLSHEHKVNIEHSYNPSEQILSSEYHVYPVRMVLLGTYPDSVHIIFIRPADKMVFFVAVKI